ncbi:MAG: hypothetical protein A2138_25095, partial [Deltaproteobacteria bacterium RBG_16_71_12]
AVKAAVDALRRAPEPRERFESVLAARQAELPREARTWGETPLSVAYRLLREAGVGQGSTVADLGAGRGAVLLAARALGAAARGCEIDPARAKAIGDSLAACDVTLEVADARAWHIDAPSHLWLSWITWPAALRAEVAARLEPLPRGTKIVALTWAPRGPFRVVSERPRLFPWGMVDVVVAERE